MKKIIMLVLVLCILLQVLTACNITDKEYDFEEKNFRFVETYGDRLIYDSNAYYIETEHACYYFDNAISRVDMNTCIRNSEEILGYINAANKINIYIISDYSEKYCTNYSLYCGNVNYKTIDYIADILLASYGEFCNYGLTYGYANYIAKQLEWDYEAENDIPDTSNNSIYDLNLLCFDSQFVSENDVIACKTLSIKFVNNYIYTTDETSFINLLIASSSTAFQTQFTTALTNWYKQNEIVHTPSIIKYAYGGETHEYIAYSEYATFFIRKDWTEFFHTDLIDANFLHMNYSEIKNYFETIVMEMHSLQEFFSFENYDNTLAVIFQNIDTSYYMGTAQHRIYLDSLNSLMHEYFHSISLPYCRLEQWVVEGSATWYSLYFDTYGLDILNYVYNNLDEFNIKDTDFGYVEKYIEYIDRKIDFDTDKVDLLNLFVYTNNIYNPNNNYISAASFIGFLISQYGEETVQNYLFSHNGEYVPLDKSFYELIEEWKTYIKTTCSIYD